MRERGAGFNDSINGHASNFYFGLIGFAVVHAFLTKLYPQGRHLFLATAVALNTGMNVIEEIDFGNGRISRGAASRHGSDWIDFTSGMLSTAVYLTVAGWLEKKAPVQVSCELPQSR